MDKRWFSISTRLGVFVACALWVPIANAAGSAHSTTVPDPAPAVADALPSERPVAPTIVSPIGITASGGAVFVADFEARRIFRIERAGNPPNAWDRTDEAGVSLEGPFAMATDGAGRLHVTDVLGQRVLVFDREGRLIARWGTRGSGPGEFDGPMGIAVDAAGHVYVTDLENQRVQKFASDGTFLSSWGGRGHEAGRFVDPWGIAVDEQDNVYVADHGNHRIQKFSPDGRFLLEWGAVGAGPGALLGPMAVAVAGDGSLYVTDLVGQRVQRFASDGAFMAEWQQASDDAGAPLRWGLAMDGSGDLLVASGAAGIESIPARGFESEASLVAPPAFALRRAWPNPAFGSMTLGFALPAPGRLRVEIYSVDGRRVRTYPERDAGMGEVRIVWDGRTDRDHKAAAGIYFVRGWFEGGGRRQAIEGRIVRLR